MTLKEIALELLKKYHISELSLIWEYSENIRESEKSLCLEVEKYKELIEENADVRKNVKGEWLESYEDHRQQISFFKCSLCGCCVTWHPNYCPECGAKMEVK